MNEESMVRIEQYLKGEMTAEEKFLFESEMKKDEELFSTVELYRSVETEMRNKERYTVEEDALKDSIIKFNSKYFTSLSNNNAEAASIKKKKRNIILFGIAAATTGIIIFSIVWYITTEKDHKGIAVSSKRTDTAITPQRDLTHQQKNTSSSLTQTNADDSTSNAPLKGINVEKQETLFAENFKADAVPDATEGPLGDAFALYRENEYGYAAEEFSNADLHEQTRGMETDPKLTMFYANYYAGISYLANKETNKALVKLENALIQSPDSSSIIKVQWYLALAYLKKNEINKLTRLLTKVAANNIEKEYQARAEELLKHLK
jgi:hypothetical protein